MKFDNDVPENHRDLPTLALVLIDVEIEHHKDEAYAHMRVGLEHPNLREQCYRFGHVHGQRLRAWRWARRVIERET